jgi:hypothetical protein
MILAAVAAETLGALGAFVSALGIALALVGIRRVRAGIDRLRLWLRPRQPEAYSGSATATIQFTVKARGKVGPGPDGWSDERWHQELDQRIDALTKELDEHDHPNLDDAIEGLREEDERVSSGLDAKLADLDAETKTSQDWELAGLVMAGVGAILQLIAFILVL